VATYCSSPTLRSMRRLDRRAARRWMKAPRLSWARVERSPTCRSPRKTRCNAPAFVLSTNGLWIGNAPTLEAEPTCSETLRVYRGKSFAHRTGVSDQFGDFAGQVKGAGPLSRLKLPILGPQDTRRPTRVSRKRSAPEIGQETIASSPEDLLQQICLVLGRAPIA